MDLRESVASTHHANLMWNDDYEKAIDKVAACGRCNALGVLLWRAKYLNEAKALRQAKHALAGLYAGRYKHQSRIMRDRVANQIMREYALAMCSVCLGVGELVEKKLRVVCRTCNGVRVKWYGDKERAAQMGVKIEHARAIAQQMQWLAEQVDKYDRQVNATLIYQLERGSS